MRARPAETAEQLDDLAFALYALAALGCAQDEPSPINL